MPELLRGSGEEQNTAISAVHCISQGDIQQGIVIAVRGHKLCAECRTFTAERKEMMEGVRGLGLVKAGVEQYWNVEDVDKGGDG